MRSVPGSTERRLHVVSERYLDAPPEETFTWVTDPAAMNRWSRARVTALRLGDGGSAAGTGAIREVRLPGVPRVVLREVVERAEPPHRFVYRVFRGASVRAHRGVIDLLAEGTGTRLRWTVDASFPVPGLATLVRARLVPELERSLDALVRESADRISPLLPPTRALGETRELSDLFRAAEEVREAQQLLVDRLTQGADPKRWFARVYQYVTEAQIAHARQGAFEHPAWALRLIPVFHLLYAANLDRFERGDWPLVEAHWLAAFRATRSVRDRFEELARSVFQGMRAHIEEDLPRALAHVYAEHYAGRADYARFRADYLAMQPVFDDAARRLRGHVGAGALPLRARALERFFPAEAEARFVASNYYDIPRKRLEAFERGERLARLLTEVKV